MGVSRDWPVLADLASRGPSVLVLARTSRGRTSSTQPGAEAFRRVFPDRGLRYSILLFAGVFLRHRDTLFDRRRVAVLDYPSMGRELLRILCDRDRRGNLAPVGSGP